MDGKDPALTGLNSGLQGPSVNTSPVIHKHEARPCGPGFVG
jgi:hypothetical protein